MMPYSLAGVYQYSEEKAASTFYPDKRRSHHLFLLSSPLFMIGT
jgi:hypothetical protein